MLKLPETKEIFFPLATEHLMLLTTAARSLICYCHISKSLPEPSTTRINLPQSR